MDTVQYHPYSHSTAWSPFLLVYPLFVLKRELVHVSPVAFISALIEPTYVPQFHIRSELSDSGGICFEGIVNHTQWWRHTIRGNSVRSYLAITNLILTLTCSQPLYRQGPSQTRDLNRAEARFPQRCQIYTPSCLWLNFRRVGFISSTNNEIVVSLYLHHPGD